MDRHETLQLDFLEVCMNGDLDQVKSMLRCGVIEINYQHRINGWSALHWAARREHEKICLALLEAGFQRTLVDSKGLSPFEVCPQSNEVLREILRPETLENEEEMDCIAAEHDSKLSFTPGYIKNPTFPYVKKQTSLDKEPVSPASPTKSGYYSYGRRDSATKTRFILVLTSSSDGKVAYKRITVPGGSTLAQLKKTVEAAMRQGPVEDLLILPDRILLEDDAQIGTLDNCQKMEVTFGTVSSSNGGVEKAQEHRIEATEKKEDPEKNTIAVGKTTVEIPKSAQSETNAQLHFSKQPEEYSAKTTVDLADGQKIIGEDIALAENENIVVTDSLTDDEGWITWMTENPMRPVMAVAIGASAVTLVWKFVIKRK